MLITDIWNFLTGTVEITAQGSRLEPFLNLCSARGIRLWEVRNQQGRFRARMSLGSFRQIRPVARRTRTRVRIGRRMGFPFLVKQAAKRRVLFVGSLFFLACLYYLSTLIWFVEIRGAERMVPSEVLSALSEVGLKPGNRKSRLNPSEIEQSLESRFPGLAQALVTFNGTRALVVLVEKAPVPSKDDRTPADLVAAKAGVVHRLVLVSGKALVREGEAVRAGQIVIQGIIEPRVPGQPGAVGVAVPVRAKGEVMARVWYQQYQEVPLKFTEKVRTGRTYSRQIIKTRGREMITWGRSPIPFVEYEEEKIGNELFTWRNPIINVETVTVTYHELVSRPAQRDAIEAVQLAEARSARDVLGALPPASQILSVKSQLLQSTAEMAGILTTVETLEDIGILAQQQPHVLN